MRGGSSEPYLQLVLQNVLMIAYNSAMQQARDGTQLTWIPPGSFEQGSNEEDWKLPGPNVGHPDTEKRKYKLETPRRLVTLTEGFWLYHTPVTVAQYRRYVFVTGRKMPKAPWFDPLWRKDDHPMVNVSWDEALAYAQWIGGTLPTEAQWEYAARSGGKRVRYPWGNTYDEDKLWEGWHHCNDGTASVRRTNNCYVTELGLMDMSGNVWQWCIDWFAPYAPGPQINPKGPTSGKNRVIRGGAFTSNFRIFDACRCTSRGIGYRGEADANIGFRVALPAATVTPVPVDTTHLHSFPFSVERGEKREAQDG
jgi:formylglycine-generating enzyme